MDAYLVSYWKKFVDDEGDGVRASTQMEPSSAVTRRTLIDDDSVQPYAASASNNSSSSKCNSSSIRAEVDALGGHIAIASAASSQAVMDPAEAVHHVLSAVETTGSISASWKQLHVDPVL